MVIYGVSIMADSIFDNVRELIVSEVMGLLEFSSPKGVYLGGSYSTNESTNVKINGKVFLFSDFDFFVLYNHLPNAEHLNSIVEKAINLADSIKQDNPYFHLGFKFRDVNEVYRDKYALYMRELAHNGVELEGTLQDIHRILSQYDSEGRELFYKKNICGYGLTRLWCNILFFPLSLMSGRVILNHVYWYLYFASRGALDWCSFRLIMNNKWEHTYMERVNSCLPSSGYNKKEKEIVLECLKIKEGNLNLDNFRDHICMVLDFGEQEAKQIVDHYSGDNIELRFLICMQACINRSLKYLDFNFESELNEADKLLSALTKKSISRGHGRGVERWEMLRNEYSDFRLLRSHYDIRDHQINTKRVLITGRC